MDENSTDRTLGSGLIATSVLVLLGFGYLAMFTVLGETAYASKFENGVLPAGFDPTSGQNAALFAVAAGVASVAGLAAAASSRVNTAVGLLLGLGLLALIPYVPLALITWQLAH